MRQYVFDLEANGLTPSLIHVLSADFDGVIKSTPNYDKMRSLLDKADVLIGHNIARYDIPVLERLLDIKINAKIVDTLALSWYLYPTRIRHGLEWWGEEFGIPKPVIDDWDSLTYDEYKHRCEEDVSINKRLWDKQFKHLVRLYGSEEGAWHLIDYLSFKMKCARMAEDSRWKLDVKRATRVLGELQSLHTVKFEALAAIMPKVAKYKTNTRPKRPYKNDGTYSVIGAKWFVLLEQKSLPESYTGEIQTLHRYEDPNPNSPEQVKTWLYDLGWKPQTFKYDRDKVTNTIRKIPQVRRDEDGVKELCPSVLKLTGANPGIEELDGITVLSHRISILKGFLENVDEEGYVPASIKGLTNTLRFKHTVLVNLPSVSKLYGTDIRGCLISPDGYELLGSDMSSLEDRTKQHFMVKYDPEYVKEMNVEGFDPHLMIGVLSGLITKEEEEFYKWYSSKH